MTFPEYYKLHSRKGNRMLTSRAMPNDVRNDLLEMINNGDKRLGVFVVHTLSSDSVDGLTFMYYIRSWHPRFVYGTFFGFDVPIGLCFWQMKRVNML